MFILRHILAVTLIITPFSYVLAHSFVNSRANDYIDSIKKVLKQCYDQEKELNADLSRCVGNALGKTPNPYNYKVRINAESKTSSSLLLTLSNTGEEISCLLSIKPTGSADAQIEVIVCDYD
ncbi:hypothetical protein [Legionella cardiaca]|uniref:Transmembrane protein n=1 Tax=Legionella cardiaca TaxID=1071983 RepID=A0ABY8APW8_9GAMM|nr:hypothetical protein [Legionella cardiaca]WED42568.1 hypothetical protein PXX05_11700 [Legionella cardiaca]